MLLFLCKLIYFFCSYWSLLLVDCIWDDWSWGRCSKTCGGGTQNATRTISQVAKHGGSNCTGLSTDTRACNPNACPGEWIKKKSAMWWLEEKYAHYWKGLLSSLFSVDCTWRNWGSWEPCSKTCGPGTKSRSRSKDGPLYGGGQCSGSSTDSASCNLKNCPGE